MSDKPTSGPIPFDDTQPVLDNAQILEAINGRFDRGRTRMRSLETSVAQLTDDVARNTAMTAENTEMTRDVHEILVAAKAGINAIAKFGRGLAAVGRFVRRVVIWSTPMVASGVAVWHFFFRDGPKP